MTRALDPDPNKTKREVFDQVHSFNITKLGIMRRNLEMFFKRTIFFGGLRQWAN